MRNKKFTVIMLLVVMILSVSVNFIIETRKLPLKENLGYSELENQLDRTVPALMKEYNVPGTAIAVIKDGRTDYLKYYGMADKEQGIKVDEDTVFQVASNSKTLAAWGIMRLVEEGKLDLDTSVEKYISNWKLPSTKFNNDAITLRRILSHTAGLSQRGYIGYPPEQKLPTLEQSISGGVKGVKKLQLIMEPGTSYKYSGGGYSLAQLIIEETTGVAFSEYMEAAVLSPLGMKNSSFVWKNELQAKTSKAYGVLGNLIPNYIFTEQAAAGLYTTVGDFARFVEENIRVVSGKETGNKVISRKYLSMMLTPVKKDYGMGYIIKDLPDDSKLVYHGGTNRGWRSQYAFLPESGAGLVVLTNSDNGENLHKDLVAIWTKSMTGYLPDFYMKNVITRVITKTVALLLGLILLIYTYLTITSIKKRRLSFFATAGVVTTRIVFSTVLKFFTAIILLILWWIIFYTGVLYNGWILASFMPLGFQWLTLVVVLVCVFQAARALFVNNSAVKNGSKTISNKIIKNIRRNVL